MNVLLVNSYSARNLGDRMIASATIRLLEAHGASVRLMSDDARDAGRYTVPRVPPPVGAWPGERRGLSSIAREARDLVTPRRQAPGFGWAHACISVGGGYLYDDGSRSSRLNLARRVATLRAARLAGLPVAFAGHSIGPFRSRLSGLATARELRRSRLVTVRERSSLERCRELGVTSVELADDCAFAAALAPPRPPVAREQAAIGVTVKDSLPGAGPAEYRRYREALAWGVVRGLAGAPLEVVVISQVDAHARDSDARACAELVGQLRAAGVAGRFVDLVEARDEEVLALYGRLDLLVASRLHSAIVAACAGTPAVGLSYMPKMEGVFERLGLPDLVLPARSLEATDLAGVIAGALSRQASLRRHLRARVPVLRSSAERGVERVLESLAEATSPASGPGPRART